MKPQQIIDPEAELDEQRNTFEQQPRQGQGPTYQASPDVATGEKS